MTADTAWKQQGACAGMNPDLFFPERGDDTREAKKVCATCTVRAECLQYSLDNHERFGLWGGKSERERRRIRRRERPTSVAVRDDTRLALIHPPVPIVTAAEKLWTGEAS